MPSFSITSNLADLERDLTDLGRRVLPRAARRAINATALDVKAAAEDRTRKTLDRPTPFTQRAWAVRYASTRTLTARVFAKDIQAAYLIFAETGGTRRPEGRALIVPGKSARLNRYGNFPRRGVKRQLGQSYFAGKPRGQPDAPAGLYRRLGTRKKGQTDGYRLKLIAVFADSATYRKKPLRFRDTARRVAAARIAPALIAALRDLAR